MFGTALTVICVAIISWAYKILLKPPPSKLCGSPGGPSITAPRIKLRDGRHLAYKEHGVSKDLAKLKIIYVHGYAVCRHDVAIMHNLSPELVQELGIYIVSFDKPGYGESDPHPKRTVKSLVLDIEELADALGLGSKFYVIGMSIGAQTVWGCIKYIPHRLAGAVLIAQVTNYWWTGFPSSLSNAVYHELKARDKWGLRVVHYLPRLAYWWNTQKWFPVLTINKGVAHSLSKPDLALFPNFARRFTKKEYVTQQGVYESLHRQSTIGFGTWEFSPLDLQNPFPNNEGAVHMWHGVEDTLVSVTLPRYIAKKLPWIHYHELPDAGHFFAFADGMSDAIIKSLVDGGVQ